MLTIDLWHSFAVSLLNYLSRPDHAGLIFYFLAHILGQPLQVVFRKDWGADSEAPNSFPHPSEKPIPPAQSLQFLEESEGHVGPSGYSPMRTFRFFLL